MGDPTANIAVAAQHNAPGLDSQRNIVPNGIKIKGLNPAFRQSLYLTRLDGGIPAPQPFAGNNPGAGVANNNRVNSWVNILSCNPQGSQYFRSLFNTIELFCVPFNQNSTLERIPPLGNGDAALICKYDNDNVAYANAQASRAANRISANTSPNRCYQPLLDTPVGRKFGGLHPITLQRSSLYRINARYRTHYYPHSDRIGTYLANNARYSFDSNPLAGPFWSPAELTAYASLARLDNGAQIGPVISTKLAG